MPRWIPRISSSALARRQEQVGRSAKVGEVRHHWREAQPVQDTCRRPPLQEWPERDPCSPMIGPAERLRSFARDRTLSRRRQGGAIAADNRVLAPFHLESLDQPPGQLRAILGDQATARQRAQSRRTALLAVPFNRPRSNAIAASLRHQKFDRRTGRPAVRGRRPRSAGWRPKVSAE